MSGFFRDNKWLWILLACAAFYTLLCWIVFGLPTRAAGDMPTEEEIAEEEYWDSLELLAICVEAEAGNQGLDGKRMVVDVILNRVDDPDWPDTIEEVISQPVHFSSYWDGSMDNVSVSDETFEAVRMELEKRSWTGIYYFTAGKYSEYGTPWRKVGDHYFSTK